VLIWVLCLVTEPSAGPLLILPAACFWPPRLPAGARRPWLPRIESSPAIGRSRGRPVPFAECAGDVGAMWG
jgi:hypothetical protein